MAKQKKTEAGAPLWFVSYADLVTNMLCFFVMMFAFMSIDSSLQIGDSIRDEQHWTRTLGMQSSTGAHQWLGEGGAGILMAPARRQHDIPRIVERVRDQLRTVPMSEQMSIQQDDQMVKIQIPSELLFYSGSARLREESKEILLGLLPVIESVDNFIRIDGHTDNIPITSPDATYPTNWELSTARACSVVRFYVEDLKQMPTRFSAQGFGEFRPIVPNTSEENREINRRVEIAILTGQATRQRESESRWE